MANYPIRPYQRFEEMDVGVGINKISAVIEFRNNDIIQPLSRPKHAEFIRGSYKEVAQSPERWAVGTVKTCSSVELVPKMQKYKNYHFINRESIPSREIKYLPTDNISIIPRESKIGAVSEYFNMKSTANI